ncbi:MAG: L-2-amino-thiazoline-4-carboxylic acid hydrolase [Lachnospiraceae bacterium]|nr:L-2-amino-thiazoline-4-carboxylic acid hydrolase [Lachnospiraceae bacterium]
MSSRKFTTIQKTCGWKQVYLLMTEQIGVDRTEVLFDKASELYREYQERYKNEKGIRKGHIMGAASAAALYFPLSGIVEKKEAIDIIAEAMKPVSVAKHNKIEKFPSALFMRIAGMITKKIFSEKAGFKRRWHCNTNKEKRYDLLTCPYVETLNKIGCPEVCPAICIQDDISFGNMKNGVVFERKGTLGRGDDCCDFCFRVKGKN